MKHTKIALTFGRRILIVLALLVVFLIGILEFAENAKEPLRLGLQDYLSQLSGGNPAEITSLEKSELFPQIDFVVKGIAIRSKEDSSKALVTADNVHIAMSFWKTFLGMADYSIFKIENLEFASGYITPEKLSLSFVGISDPSPASAPPYFVLDGAYHKQPLLVTAEMRRKTKGQKLDYDFASEIPVTFKLGSTEVNARFLRSLSRVEFAQFVLVSGGRKVVLATQGLKFKPLHARFIGDMAELPLSGELMEQPDGHYLISITPGSEDPEFLANLEALIASTQADLGLKKDDTNIKIEIKAPVVAQQGIVENKEQK